MTPLNRKPLTAAWIQRERKRLGWKPKDVADKLSAMNLPVSEATVKVWESNADRRPSPYNLEGLEQLFGSQSPMAGASDADTTALVPALLTRVDDLVSTVSELVRLVRTGDEDREARLRALEAEVRSLREQREGEASPGRSVPQTTAG